MNKIICKKCGCQEHYRKEVPPHIGAYCVKCDAWITWLPRAAQQQYEAYVASLVNDLACTVEPVIISIPPNHGRSVAIKNLDDVRKLLNSDKTLTNQIMFGAHELPNIESDDDTPPWEDNR